MAISQTGATYKNQAELSRRDRLSGEAFDDLASQIAVIRSLGNFGLNGKVSPPSSPTSLQVSGLNGLFTASVAHNNAPAGTRYILQYSASPTFEASSTISEELGNVDGITTTWQKSLPAGTRLYFRIASMFPSSSLSSWVYAGGAVAPTLIG